MKPEVRWQTVSENPSEKAVVTCSIWCRIALAVAVL